MTVYLDTSVVLRVLFDQAGAWPAWGRWKRAYASDLLGVEARRTIDRMRLESLLDDAGVAQAHQELGKVEKSLGRVHLNRAVLQRAALPMPTVVKTLDAVHLATAILFRERRGDELVFATHDRSQAIAARALGFEVIGNS